MASSSTPSAMTRRPKSWAKVMVLATIAAARGSASHNVDGERTRVSPE